MRKVTVLLALLLIPAFAADQTKLEVVVKNVNGTAIGNASVVVKFIKGRSKVGKLIRTSWELRTNEEGSVKIPSIPQGKIEVQVIAKNYQTYGQIFDIDQPEKTIEVTLNPPQPQYSAH